MDSVTLSHLSIGYNGRRDNGKVVLSDICATIKPGELTCLIGSNGVGKSTLLRTLANFQPKLSGEIYIKDREIGTFTAKELARVIGVVLTEKPDVANMTATDMVLMGRSPYTGFWGVYSDGDRNAAKRAIAMMGIGSLADRLVSTLSDGERQKVMIAKALAQETPIVYLDEPTAFLDYPSKVEIMRLLHRISKETQKTVFLSTHDLELALQLADTVWLMDRAKGIHTGTPEDLALDGILPAFFDHHGVAFNPATGLFSVEADIIGSIKVTGDRGFRRTMLEKALLRNGIAPDDSGGGGGLDVGGSAFILRHHGEGKAFGNIASAIAAVLHGKAYTPKA